MVRRVCACAAAAALGAATIACGQKPGVATQQPPAAAARAAAGGGLAGTEGAATIDGNSDLGAAATDPGDFGGGGSATVSSGAATGGTAAAGSDGGASGNRLAGGSRPGPATQGAPAGGDSTGVDDRTITIGMHAPLTGAAPLPSASVEKGVDLYWNWLKSQGKSIAGRDVDVVLKNDQFNPSHAVAVCKEMVEKNQVFMLMGFSAADEVSACARYAESVGVPYVSGGVTETGVRNLRGYFAVWTTFESAGPLMADLFVDRLGARGERNGFVTYSTPNTDGAQKAFLDAMSKRGAKIHYNREVSKNSGQRTAEVIALEMKQAGIENAYMLVSPFFWFQIAHASANQGYFPQWTGIAAIDDIAQHGCNNRRSIDNARFFHFTPAFVDSNKYDPAFRKAGGSDSIQWALWGLMKQIAYMLAAPDRDLSRERFVYIVERKKFQTGVLPPVSYAPTDHFGGNAFHLLRAECDLGKWVTEKAFASDF